jgi:hypothetical protein
MRYHTLRTDPAPSRTYVRSPLLLSLKADMLAIDGGVHLEEH